MDNSALASQSNVRMPKDSRPNSLF